MWQWHYSFCSYSFFSFFERADFAFLFCKNWSVASESSCSKELPSSLIHLDYHCQLYHYFLDFDIQRHINLLPSIYFWDSFSSRYF